jgi:hypothetical protein
MEWLDKMVRGITGYTGAEPIKAEPMPVQSGEITAPDYAVYIPGNPTNNISVRQNNPGNLKHVGQKGSLGAGTRDFAIFPTPEEGFAALQRQIDIDKGRQLTLNQFGNKYAPSFENDTTGWVRDVAKMTGATPDTPLSVIPTFELAKAVAKRESSAKIHDKGDRSESYFKTLKQSMANQGAAKPESYQIASAGAKIPAPPIRDYDPNGPDVSYLDSLISGESKPIPTISAGNGKMQSPEQMPPQNTEPAPFHAQVGAAYVDDPQTKFKILAKFRFPFEKPELAAKRYFMRDGNTFYMTNDGKIHKEEGEGISEKAKTFMASLLGRAPEIVGGAAGAVSPIPGGMELGTVAGGLARRGSNQAIYGEKPDYLSGAIGDAAGAALSRIPAAGITKGLNFLGKGGQIGRMVANDPGTFDAQEAARLMQLGGSKGIRLTAPEIANSPTLEALWANLANNPRWPNANQKMAEFIKQTRNPEVSAAIRKELSAISPVEDISPFDSGTIVTQTAKNMLDDLKTTRAAESQPLYQRAFESAPKIDTEPVLKQIDGLMAIQPRRSSGQEALGKIRDMLTRTEDVWDTQTNKTIKKEVPVTNIETLDNVKIEIDRMLEAAKQDKSISNRMRQRLTSIKEELLTQMDTVSPEYGQARAKFAELSGPINKFQYGTANLGPRDPKVKTIMQRLIDLGGEDMEKAPGIIFSGKPEAISRTKRWFSANGYDPEWNTVVRARLEQQLNKVADSIANREGNLGYAFKRKVFGTGEDMEKLKAAMSPQQFASFKGLMEVMDQTTKIVYTNSRTAMQQGATQSIENMGGGVIARALTNIPVTPQQMGQVLIRLKSPENASKLADALLDPATAPKIQAMRLLPNGVKKTTELMSFLGTIYGERKLTSPRNVRNEASDAAWTGQPER